MRRLTPYRRKRDFALTPEPDSAPGVRRTVKRSTAENPRYVVQLHHARRRHFDFRLELDGSLRSWAIPKGPSRDPQEKRLAVEVEDHPLDYAQFEGEIPSGQYGAGRVDIWDEGYWQADGDAGAALNKGHLDFSLYGKRLRGHWTLIRTRIAGRQPQWLLIKRHDAHEQAGDIADDTPLREWRCPSTPRQRAEATQRADAPDRSQTSRRRRQMPEPFPDRIDLQLARLVDTAPPGHAWTHEIKYDGYRLVAFRDHRSVRIVSRNGIDWTGKLPELCTALLALDCRRCILDGELVAYDDKGHTRFDLLQQHFAHGGPVTAVMFDLLYLDHQDLRSEPLYARQQALQRLLENAPPVLQRSEIFGGSGRDAFSAACQLGLEGIVSKAIDAPYRGGRGGEWLKVKCTHSEEFVIVGYTKGRGARAELGSLLLAQPAADGPWRYVGRVGSGLSEAVLADLRRRMKPVKRAQPLDHAPGRADLRGAQPIWVAPRLVVEVEFRAWTQGGILRQASLKGLRPDKSTGDLQRPDAAPRLRSGPASPRVRPSKGDARKRASRAKEGGTHTLTHPERHVFTTPVITKAELAQFYTDLAEQILPGISARPLALLRCPDGVGGECFFQKHLTPGFPATVHAAPATQQREPYVYIDDLDGLLGLVQMNVIEIHPWGAPLKHPQIPDRLIFDLDPADDVPWKHVLRAAQELRERLIALKLESFPRVSGGKGLHVVVPLSGKDGWDAVKAFAHAMARTMTQESPDRYIDVASKAQRQGRIFIDYLRNGRGATAIASYSLRARPGAPIAAAIDWREVRGLRKPAPFGFSNIRARIKAKPDPWAGFDQVRQALPR